jgi:hypothetical protein
MRKLVFLYKNIVINLLSLLLFVSFPLVANASTTITISHNGAGSQNSVTVNNTTIFTIIQSNVSNIFNTITGNANTGNNKCNNNTGGKCKIKTGNADSNITITNHANSNIVSVPEFSESEAIVAGILCLGAFMYVRKRVV